jgi:ABC-type nitrate/sulfonate/bicarbonate transport system permease component
LGDDTAELKMPTFTRTASSFLELARSGELWSAFVESNKAMVLGYVAALCFGIPLGIVLGSLPFAKRVLEPYLTALLVVPLIAILPLIQAIFGLGLLSRVVVVFLFAFVFMTVNTMVGVNEVDFELRSMARSFGAGRLEVLSRVTLPSAFPSIVAGSRLGLARAVVGMVIAELFLVSEGMGSLIIYYRTLFDSGAVFALAISLVLEGSLIMRLAGAAEGAITRKWLR